MEILLVEDNEDDILPRAGGIVGCQARQRDVYRPGWRRGDGLP